MGEILVGTAGWRYEDWNGIVYPSKKPSDFQELTYISQLFDTVEVNSTFYHPAKASTAEGWIKKTRDNPRFIFTAKLWQRFTHDHTPFTPDEVKIVKDGLAPLQEAERLGAVLAQFPWRFKNNERERAHLSRIMDVFSTFPLVIELRHASWDNAATLDFLNARGVGIAAVDQPVIGKSIAPKSMASGSMGYVRLHGRNYQHWFNDTKDGEKHPLGKNARYDYLYSKAEIDEWARHTLKIAADKKKTFVIHNNHPWGQAVANAIEMKSQLGQTIIDLPEHLFQRFPRLHDLGMHL